MSRRYHGGRRAGGRAGYKAGVRAPPPLRRFWPLLAVAGVLWFWPVGWSLWTDEFFSAGFANRSLESVAGGASRDRHPPLFFFGVKLFGLFGKGDDVLRALSGVAMLGALAFTVDAARRHLPARAAWAAGVWFVGSSVPALFAHTLRMYSLATLACAAMTWGALEASEDDGVRARRGRWALACGGIAAFWTHYAATLVGLAAFAVVFAVRLGRPARDRALLPVIGAAAAVVVGCLPWVLGPLQTQLAEKIPQGARVWEVWAYLFWSPNERLAPLSFAAFAIGIGGALWLARRARKPVSVFATVFLIAMIVLPFLMSANVPARLVRNYVGFFPAAALFSGAALHAVLARLSERVPAPSAAVLAGLLTLPATVALLRQPVHPQDINTGHDYRLEAEVLDRLIPKDATVRFQPAYVVEQFARYAPALRDRVAGRNAQRDTERDTEWKLLTTGGEAGECLILHAFRVRVQAPPAACSTLGERLSAEADRTGYPGLLLERATRKLAAGEVDAAGADLDRVLAAPQRWPVAWLFAAQVAQARGDTAGTLVAYEHALALARAYETPGAVISTIWKKIAKLRATNEDSPGAAAAMDAAACAAEREPMWACGGPLAWATRTAEPEAEELAVPPPAPSPVRAPVEASPAPAADSVEPPPPRAAKPAVAKAAPPKVEKGAGGQSFSFADGVPAGWLVEGVVAPEAGGLRIGDGRGAVGTVCSPPLTLAGPITGRVTRGVTVHADTPTTWSRIEARALGADLRLLSGTRPENLGSKKATSDVAPSAVRWTPPVGAVSWRLCVRTSGAANGSTLLMGIDLD